MTSTTRWSCSCWMIMSQTVVLPEAVPPETPAHFFFSLQFHIRRQHKQFSKEDHQTCTRLWTNKVLSISKIASRINKKHFQIAWTNKTHRNWLPLNKNKTRAKLKPKRNGSSRTKKTKIYSSEIEIRGKKKERKSESESVTDNKRLFGGVDVGDGGSRSGRSWGRGSGAVDAQAGEVGPRGLLHHVVNRRRCLRHGSQSVALNI